MPTCHTMTKMPLPIIRTLVPLIPLDSPQLAHGPYTDEQFQTDHVAVRDCGLLYGYTYRPVRFTGDETGVMGTSSMHVCCRDDLGRVHFGDKFPWCATEEDAVQFLKRHGYYGHVLRFALDGRVLRGEYESVTLLAGSPAVTRPREPWITAGITDIVNAPASDAYHGHILTMSDWPTIHVRQADFKPTNSTSGSER